MKDRHNKPEGEQKPHDAKHAAGEKQTPPAAAADTQKPAATPSTEVVELKDRLLRLQADFDNFRKRSLREKNELYERATADFILQILPVLDHFDLGLRSAQSRKLDKGLTEGFQMVYDQMMDALKKNGVSFMECVGQVFDHQLHEAIAHVASEEYPADVIVAETRRGYTFGGKLLRAAQVVVSSGPATAQPTAQPASPTDKETGDAGEKLALPETGEESET